VVPLVGELLQWSLQQYMISCHYLITVMVRTRGSHQQLHHPDKRGTVTMAGRRSKDLSPAMRASIVKQAGLERGTL